MNLKNIVRGILSDEQIIRHRKKILLTQTMIGRLFPRDLRKLALIFGTDKWGDHNYCQYYQKYFEAYRSEHFNLLEIGVGGDESEIHGGNSLRMWARFFPKAYVYGIDIHEKSAQASRRIKIFRGSQNDGEFLFQIADQIGTFKIIIDDGSHICEHIVKSFETLFPYLESGGVYVIEDTETAYRGKQLDIPRELDDGINTVTYFKRLVHGLNYREFGGTKYVPSYFDLNIVSIQFFHNLIFVFKGDNAITR